MAVFQDALDHTMREEPDAAVFQICLKNDQLLLEVRQT